MDAPALPPAYRQLVQTFPFRLGVFGLLAVAVYQGVYEGTKRYGADVMGSENGVIEVAQVVCAAVAAICLFYAAFRTRSGRGAVLISAALVAYATAREADMWFEQFFFDDAYKWLVGLPMISLVFATLWVQRTSIVQQSFEMVAQPAGTLFVLAGIVLCGVCQTLDRPGMWSMVSDPTEAALAKAMLEEYFELFAYLLLFYSGIEAVMSARQRRLELVLPHPKIDVNSADGGQTTSLAA